MPRARVNGIEIDYEDGGRGPAVLLSHGYSATGRMWAPQRPVLEPRYRLITWDMRGHGQTESPADPAQYSEPLTVADMRGLLDHLGIQRAVVGGLSLGGYMSLAFHRRHPEMVRALVICDSGPGYRNPDARAAWNQRAHERARDLETRGLDALTASSREMREAMRHHRSAQGLAHAARGMLAQEDASVIDSLPAIRVPTLIVLGDRDTPFVAPCEYMAKKIAGARLEVIKDAGHSSNLDQPEAFNRVLLDFLDALPDRA
jgi:pimeloyl-ACP methyl ester carboxylesterase